MKNFCFILLIFLFNNSSYAVDFIELKNDAMLSDTSYFSQNLIAEHLQENKYELIHYQELPETALSYFLASSSEGVQYLSFRGTSNLENALVDIDVSLMTDEVLGIQLHQGFASATRAAYENVKPYLNASQPIVTTGHSLGGAVAVIMAMYLQKDGYLLDRVTTFGQPKVTNVFGARKFSNLPLTRVVTPKDIVPLVPPLSPLQLKDLDIYWHMGQEVLLLVDNKYARLEGLNSMMRATKFVSNVPDETNLTAHQMNTYITKINQKIENSEQVNYEMSLFGFVFN